MRSVPCGHTQPRPNDADAAPSPHSAASPSSISGAAEESDCGFPALAD